MSHDIERFPARRAVSMRDRRIHGKNTKTILIEQLEAITANLCRVVAAEPVTGTLLDGTIVRDDYVTFLSQTYHYVRETSSLLLEAADVLRQNGRLPELSAYYEQKAREEEGHDRRILDDLEALDAPADPAQLPAATLAVTVYLGWHRGLIRCGKPLGFFAAAWILESLAAGSAPAVVERLRARADIPGIAGALRFLTGHGAADVGHIAVLEEQLRRIEDPDDLRTIVTSARVSADLYPRFFRSERRSRAGSSDVSRALDVSPPLS